LDLCLSIIPSPSRYTLFPYTTLFRSGMGIALEALGSKYYEIALESGMSPEVFHRVASLASGGLDTLPHNGAVLTLLTITGMSHRDSYKDIFVVAVLLPVISVIIAILFSTIGIY